MLKRNQGIRTKDSRGDTYTQSWRQVPVLTEVHPYQALDDLQQFLHDHSDALVTQESADGLKMRGPHKVPVGAVDVAIGNVERLENRGCSKVSSWELNRCSMSAGGRCFADTNLMSSTLSHGELCEWVYKILAMERDMINNHRMEYRSLDGAGVAWPKRRKDFPANIIFTGTPATYDWLSTHKPGLLQTEPWGEGKTDDFLSLETCLALEEPYEDSIADSTFSSIFNCLHL